jgi:tRNA threonylcarbamoyladenosine biosynthesis protein TsaE
MKNTLPETRRKVWNDLALFAIGSAILRRCVCAQPVRCVDFLVTRIPAAYNSHMPVMDRNTVDIISQSPEQTRRLGARLGELLRPGDLILLRGELGAGKTTLAQGIARGWGAEQPATSPTFVLVREYRRASGGKLYHLDAYRLSKGEHPGIDLSEALEEGAAMVEWPERLAPPLPENRVEVELRWLDETRRGLRVWAVGAHAGEWIQKFQALAFG